MQDESTVWGSIRETLDDYQQRLKEYCLEHPIVSIAGIVVFLFCIWHTVVSLYLSYHRKVIVIGARAKEYEVIINERPVTLKPNKRVELEMAEGDFHIRPSRMAGSITPSTIRLETSFWSRPYVSAVLVINPDRLAILRKIEAFYGNIGKHAPDDVIYCNLDAVVITGIDYLFELPPHQITLIKTRGSGPPGAIKCTLQHVHDLSDRDRVELISKRLRNADAQAYLELWLKEQPENHVAVQAIQALKEAKASWSDEKPLPREAPSDELASRLAERPLPVSWHRAYQDTFLQKGEEGLLVGAYRKLYQGTPRDNVARYLLSRVCPLDEEARLLKESVESGSSAPHAHFVLGCQFLAEGRFREAAQQMRLIKADDLDHPDFRRFAKLAYLGAKDRTGYLSMIPKEPGKLVDPVQLLVSQFQFDVIFDKSRVLDISKKGIAVPVPKTLNKSEAKELSQTVLNAHQLAAALSTKDIYEYIRLLSSNNQSIPPVRLAILKGNIDEALALVRGSPSSKDPFFDKALVLLAQPKEEEGTAHWEELKESFLEEMGRRRHEGVIQQMIEDEIPFDMNLVHKAACDPESKRILVYLAAKWMPKHAEELKEFARLLDFPCDEISLCLKKINP